MITSNFPPKGSECVLHTPIRSNYIALIGHRKVKYGVFVSDSISKMIYMVSHEYYDQSYIQGHWTRKELVLGTPDLVIRALLNID